MPGFGGGFTFGEIGEEQPEYGFNQYLTLFGQTDPLRTWLSRNYNQFRQDYLGQYMGALSGGQETPSWLSYLQGFDPWQQFAYASPRERGEYPGQYQGRVRSIY